MECPAQGRELDSVVLIGPLKLSIIYDSKKWNLSQLIKNTIGSLIKKLLKLIVILIGYVVLHDIYRIGMFSMRYQHADENLNS